DLDGLEVVEAQPVSGRRNEGGIVRMRTVDVDGAETLAGGCVAGPVDRDLVGTLAVEDDAAVLADQLEAVVHLAAVRDAARFDRPDGAALEADQHPRPVLVLDGPGRSITVATMRIGGLRQAAQRGDRAAERARDGDDVPPEIAQRAGTARK